MTHTERTGRGGYALGITLVAALGGALFGYDTAVISGAVGALNWYFVLPRGLPETAANSLLGLTVSGALLGCVIGGGIAGFMGNRFGRKRSLLVSALLFVVTSVGSAMPELGFAPVGQGGAGVLTQFILYRMIGGVGVGMVSLLSPMYIAEIAPAARRGRLVSLNQLAIIIGMLAILSVNYLIARQGDDAWINRTGWRWMFGSEVVPAVLFALLLLWIPESPRWLVMKGREGEAARVLARLHDETPAGAIVAEIRSSLGAARGALLAFGPRVILVGVLLAFFQQFVGINVVLYYGPEIFRTIGNPTDAAMLQTLLVGVVNFLFTIVAIRSVDRFGRKPLQIAGALVMAASMAALGFVFLAAHLGLGALICMMVFMAAFSCSWGPIAWVLIAEIYPNVIRGKAMSLAVAVMWVANYCVSWTFPMLDKSTLLTSLFHHGFAYWLYALMALLAALFMWKWVPETKGKTLEEMEALWRPRTGAR
ncbi:MAG TPA: D-xylose transporter XylE [Bacteroidota bacterium]|nr:D-xylose transporter XylE [Bacteroidota bacterium]